MTYIEIDTEVCEALRSIAAYLQSIDASLVSIAGTLRQTNTPKDEDKAHAAELLRAIENTGIGNGDGTFTASQLLEEIYREVPICKGEYEITGDHGGSLVCEILSSLSDETARAALKGTLTPRSIGKSLSGMKDTKFPGCPYILRGKRGIAGTVYYLEEKQAQKINS